MGGGGGGTQTKNKALREQFNTSFICYITGHKRPCFDALLTLNPFASVIK